MNESVLLVFSHNRPMQLELTLRSFILNCKDEYLIDKVVLYKCHKEYEEAYNILIKEYPSVKFFREFDFKANLLSIVHGYEYILFSVDDSVYYKEFFIQDMKNCLAEDKEAIGFSLRLGTNTDYCYPCNQAMIVPEIIASSKNGIGWSFWGLNSLDFGYPLEISSSFYPFRPTIELIKYLFYENPNQLESALDSAKMVLKSQRKLYFYKISRAFSNPVNKVQKVNNNRYLSDAKYEPENLLKEFLNGKRIDMKHFNFVPNACHVEVKF